jgi:hypothetical protein
VWAGVVVARIRYGQGRWDIGRFLKKVVLHKPICGAVGLKVLTLGMHVSAFGAPKRD